MISGNGDQRSVSRSSRSNGNVVAGNQIGTDVTGTRPSATSRAASRSTLARPAIRSVESRPSRATSSPTTVGRASWSARQLRRPLHRQPDHGQSHLRQHGTGHRPRRRRGDCTTATSPRQGPEQPPELPDHRHDRRRPDSRAGWAGSTPDTTFRIDFFASAGYGPGGSGEAEDYLGSLEVTTDASGQVSLRRPLHRAGRAAHRHGHGHRSPGQHLGSLGPSRGPPCRHRL